MLMENENLKEYMLKEIDIIENTIKRMAFNSFLIKGWSITLITAVLLLKGSILHIIVSFLPLSMFWYLDAYFLWQERAYRKLYGWIIQNRLKTDELLFDMNAGLRFGQDIESIPKIMTSKTLIIFYGTILLLIMGYMLVSCYNSNVFYPFP